jgi:hypothetical protein
MIADPIKKRVSAMTIDLFLPNRSLIHPPTAAPITAPASAVLTIADCEIIYKVLLLVLQLQLYI